ncbi:dipeptide transport system permease DppC [Streptomyces himastatinicus ATCC 53653]|uniref:Dipeptide transport system permease DppC n=1 Tax=Streptomyces himastatinicus ATCC 53653 TaxID=457427 RepID=D9WP35_9ACTN|nr:dipeptide transport system permease DppC [Streptomyces himastatinicus ATCC 53653]
MSVVGTPLPDAEAQGLATSQAAPPTSGRRIAGALRRDRAAVASAAFLGLLCLVALCAPLITALTGWGPYAFDSSAVDTGLGGVPRGSFGGIGSEHLFGVEPQNGRDILARIVHGARVSLLIALSCTLLTGVLGVVLGMLAGFYRGWVDQVISRLMDFLMAFPALIFMIAILSSLPTGNRAVLLVVVISGFGLARISPASSGARRGRWPAGSSSRRPGRRGPATATWCSARSCPICAARSPSWPRSPCPATSVPRPGCPSSASASPRPPRPGAR